MTASGESPSPALFCERCLAASTDQTPGDVSSTNGIGRKFYGSADPCTACGSVVRTLWWTFIDLPLVPRGSYRYKTASESGIQSRFWCRRTATHWGQVWKTWIVGIVVWCAVLAALLYFFPRGKK